MTDVIKIAADDLIELFYEKGIAVKLLETWNGFKDAVLGYCVEEDLSNVRKYIDGK